MSVHALYDLSSGDSAGLEEHSAQLDRRIFDMQALLKSVEALHNELDLEHLCRLLLAMAQERLRVADAAVLLTEPSTGTVVVTAWSGLDPSVETISFPAHDGILWRLLLAGEPFSIVDMRGKPRFAELFEQHGLSRLAGRTWVPLAMPGKVVGVLSLGAPSRPTSEEDHTFLKHLASQAAVAINTSLLYTSIQVARRDLDRSLHKLSMLFDVTRALGAVQDLTRLLRMILQRAIESVEAEKGSLMLLDEPSDELVMRVVLGLPDKEAERRINDGEMQCARFRRGEGIAGGVLESGLPVRVNKVDEEKGFTKREGSQHVRSILCVPLKVDDETLGVINITNRKDGGAFGAEDEEILGALANQAALAIARTRLYEAAITDGLTGLFVRRFCLHRLGEEAKRVRRYGNRLSVIMCDIDHFKSVNDTYGHQAGDEVIRMVSRSILAELRTDVDVAGRYGGEEFLLILPQTGAREGAVAAERLRATIERAETDVGDGRMLRKTMSFGVAELTGDETVEQMIGRADEALYRSKETGRNRVTIAGPKPGTSTDLSAETAPIDVVSDASTSMELLAPEADEGSTPKADEERDPEADEGTG